MDKYNSAAHQFLMDKGCKSNGETFTALQVKQMLSEFASDQESSLTEKEVKKRKPFIKKKKTVEEVFNLFIDGKERYYNDPLFNKAVNYIVAGTKSYDIIDNMIKIINDLQRELKDNLMGKLTLKKVLDDAEARGAKYSLQYADYSSDTWTVGIEMVGDRKNKILSDDSITKVRIEYEVK